MSPEYLDRLSRRFVSQFAPCGECWVWTGALMQTGYGCLHVAGKTAYAHRVSWELYHGEIPAGLQIDHLCRNRRCVNPDHLEVVTAQVNVFRAVGLTECKRGHALTEDNCYRPKEGGRRCRKCHAFHELHRHRAMRRMA